MFNKVKSFLADRAQNDLQGDTNFLTDEILDKNTIIARLPLIANPGLISAMRALQEEETVHNRIRFQQLIKSARLFIALATLGKLSDKAEIIVHDDSEAESYENNHQVGIKIAHFKKDNKYYYYVFTNLDSLEKWHRHSRLDNSRSEANIVTFRDLCGLVLSEDFDASGIIINAGCEGFLVEYQFFKQMSRKHQDQLGVNRYGPNRSQKTNKGATNALIHALDLSQIAPEFAADLTSMFHGITQIHAVWISVMAMKEQRHFALIVDFIGQEDDIFKKLLDICAIHLDDSEKAIAFSAKVEPFNMITEQFPAVFIRAN